MPKVLTALKKTVEKKLWLGVKEVKEGGRRKTRRNEKERNAWKRR